MDASDVRQTIEDVKAWIEKVRDDPHARDILDATIDASRATIGLLSAVRSGDTLTVHETLSDWQDVAETQAAADDLKAANDAHEKKQAILAGVETALEVGAKVAGLAVAVSPLL